MEMIGKILGNRYEILEEIGSGGMATVYKAKCKLLNRNVAIKILRDEFANDAEFIKRFQVEAQAAASLSHPNIVSIYDVGNENGLHYIVMELIDGKTLKEIINEKGRLPWREAVKIASQIASGLEQAHNNHIVHRDIKPHNIIITKDNIAKVTDFGIAKAVSNSTINAYGSTIGSVHYFSPEHARGGYTDEKSDIYSLGVVLYEMVTGQLPFNAETPVSVALKHLQEEPKEPMDIVSDIPMALNEIILKAMQKDVNNRYATAALMYNDLQKVLKNQDVGNVRKINDNKEFPTQKIPIIGADDYNKDREIVLNIKERARYDGDRDMSSEKKKVTKKQAITKLVLFIVLAVGLFAGAFFLAVNIAPLILGSATIEVPALVGKPKEEAEELLNKAGLNMEIQAILNSTEYDKDVVIYQEYAEGYRLKSGATVRVNVSKGAKTVFVPDVTNMSTGAAKIEIEKNNLVYEEVSEASSTVEVGGITRQEPTVNTEVKEGSSVKVYISVGPVEGMVAVPTVVGKSEEKARQEITAAKLIPEVITTAIKDKSKADGVVLSQTPEQNTTVSELTTITLVVNRLASESPSSGSGEKEDEKEEPDTGKRNITINLKNKGARENFMVKVVVQGLVIGSKVEYEGMHSRSEGSIVVPVTDEKSAIVKVYIDDVLDSEMVL